MEKTRPRRSAETIAQIQTATPGSSSNPDLLSPSSAHDKDDSPTDSFAESGLDAPSAFPTERRRSERVKREKPDYYDALDFDHKQQQRKSTPTRPKREKSASASSTVAPSPVAGVRSPRVKEADGRSGGGRGRPPGRATLTWKKGQDEDEDERDRRRRKRPRQRDGESEDLGDIMDLSTEKILQCRASLAEINRKLSVVRTQPV